MAPDVALTKEAPAEPAEFRVRRWTILSMVATPALVAFVVALAVVPYVLGRAAVVDLTSLLILVIMAAMWNALAGYGGLVSVGQQAYIGFGAYGTIYLTQHNVTPYLAMVLAALAAGVLALPVSLLVLRLRGGQFAIGTWVVAEVFLLLVALDKTLGGGTGISLQGLNRYELSDRRAYTYWLTLAFTVLLLGTVFLLLRSRVGTSLQAIRDDEEAAASLGVRVMAGKRLLFVLAAFGGGAAGALTLANTLFIQPQTIFGVQYSAFMIFMVLVGGLGTFEGPILGAILLYVVQNQFSDHGAWYLIGLGATAIVFALLLPRGLWGVVQSRWRLQLLPLGHRLQPGRRVPVPAPRPTEPT